MEKRLYRSSKDRMLGGVCGGLGEYFDIDPVIVRIVFVVLALANGIGILAYLVLWIVMPQESEAGAPPRATIRSNIDSIGYDIRSAFQPGTTSASGGGPATPGHRRPTAAFLLGAVLVALGVILLLDNLNLLWWLRLSQLWPLVLVAAGVALLLGRGRRR